MKISHRNRHKWRNATCRIYTGFRTIRDKKENVKKLNLNTESQDD